jgi:hypothetical protein
LKARLVMRCESGDAVLEEATIGLYLSHVVPFGEIPEKGLQHMSHYD